MFASIKADIIKLRGAMPKSEIITYDLRAVGVYQPHIDNAFDKMLWRLGRPEFEKFELRATITRRQFENIEHAIAKRQHGLSYRGIPIEIKAHEEIPELMEGQV